MAEHPQPEPAPTATLTGRCFAMPARNSPPDRSVSVKSPAIKNIWDLMGDSTQTDKAA